MKDGYLLIDDSPLDIKPLNKLMEFVTVRVGHFEINYGDAHFRRTDNGNAVYNPFVGNYMLDAFTTEIGAEVYVRNKAGLIAMGSVTGGEVRGTVLTPGKRGPSLHRKARLRSPGERQDTRAAHRLHVSHQQRAEQHPLQWRPRRLALLLHTGEHRRDGVGAGHIR